MILTSICCNSHVFHTHKLQMQNFSLGLFIMIFTFRLNVRQRVSCKSCGRDVHDRDPRVANFKRRDGGGTVAGRWRDDGGTVAGRWRDGGGTVAGRWRDGSGTS